MNREKVLFLIYSIILVGLFVLCGYSLIQCFVYNPSGDSDGSHVLEIIYLFLHLIMLAIVFYLSFRAFKIKTSIVNLIMLDENGVKMKKSLIISAIIAVFFLFSGIYATLAICGLRLPPFDIFPIGMAHDIMNAGYFFGSIALICFIYPFIKVESKETN